VEKSEKTIRFFKSIQIEDSDRFDLDLVSCKKSSYQINTYLYGFMKNNPWTYEDLDEFIYKLGNIKDYNYLINFTYLCNITIKDANNLLNEFLESKYDIKLDNYNVEFIVRGHAININVIDELDLTKEIEDFNELLKFINYSFIYKFTHIIDENNKVLLDKSDYEEINKKLDESYDAFKEEYEQIAINEAKNALENKQIEERNKNLYKNGNYQEILLESIDSNSEAVSFVAKIFEIDIRNTKKNGIFARIGLVGNNDAIYGRYNLPSKSNKIEEVKKLKVGDRVRIYGRVGIDDKNKQLFVQIHDHEVLESDEIIVDDAKVKRVELHLHTNMSDMDGIVSIDKYCEVLSKAGYKAVGVTDHADVQAFPLAQDSSKKYGIKINYGSELYMIEDYFIGAIKPREFDLNRGPIVVFDLESTGLNIRYDKITEIGAVKIVDGMIVDRFDELVNPGIEIPKVIEEKTKITNQLVKNKPSIKEILPFFLKFIDGSVLVSHNLSFDYNLLNEEMVNNGFKELENSGIDTLALSHYLFPANRSHNLESLSKRLNVVYDKESAHRGDYDAEVLSECYLNMRNLLKSTFKDEPNLFELEKLPIPEEFLKHWNRGGEHIVVYAKNRIGLKNLYKLISLSQTKYIGVKPFIPRSEIIKHKEGLLFGSACSNGEVFISAFRKNLKELEKAINFYDYIEIQPLENYSYLINDGTIRNEEDLKKNVLDIIHVAEQNNKLIVATGDCHYLFKEQKKYRDIYIETKGIGGVLHPLKHYNDDNYYPNPDVHFRTTNEMIDCFSWISKEKAYEYVVTNSNLINDMIEDIKPIPEKLCPPSIDNCDNILHELCYKTAHELYGDPLPEFIENRLSRELDGIISNGYAVTYYIAHELVRRSNELGYIVGSRGSVGSSFAATMAGITEVNPLPPHYRCPKCKHFELYEGNEYKSGFDLPSKKCPHCEEIMESNGQSIPFETFLGFHAEKVPDIDLNFPADFQTRAFLFTRDIFEKDHVFRAGTISTVQFKTAYGYVKKYFETFNIEAKPAYINALAYGCCEVKRTTGQHPGGIVIIPLKDEVYDYCPIQYPAGETTAEWKTTHFDFSSIHDTLLKVDMLGHVDPQALRMMCLLTNVDYKKIPMNDPKVLSIFTSDDSLNLKHKYMEKDNGALGIPEFGTELTRQVLRETQPKTFNDLLIISGLTHGTNVYQNNQQDLIKSGQVDLNGVIGCRDDIMTYLINKGIPSHEAFTIMEIVRKKDKHLTSELIDLMRSKNIPEYYINSCEKIEYLFPKGHACAYVTMGVRVGYFKVYYPLEFYATFFTLRADDYDIKAMIGGIDAINKRLVELKEKRKANSLINEFTKKDGDILACLDVALEMVERGYRFLNIDLNKSDAFNFIVDKEQNGILAPFKTLPGFGESAGSSIIKARSEKPFTSKDDLLKRSGITKTNLKDLDEMGVLKGLPENDDVSLFDFNF